MDERNLIQITERGDPRVAPFVSVRERDLTGGADGRFIVEGKVPLSILLTQSRFAVESLFLCESRLAPLSDILKNLPPNVPVYTAPQAMMDEIAGFPIHRGILACAKKGDALPLDGFLDAKRLLILNEISNHDNVGAAFRNAAAFGADGVLLDASSCDPLYRKAIRVSSGASLWLPYHHAGTGLQQVDALKRAGFEIWAMTPRLNAAPLQTLSPPEKLAILLGAEGPGLPEALIKAAKPVQIPMRAGFDSVNVATAGAIALAHVFSSE
ncbi:MAG: RNA methyltransferase [Pseudomonadota bacterium]